MHQMVAEEDVLASLPKGRQEAIVEHGSELLQRIRRRILQKETLKVGAGGTLKKPGRK